MWSTNPPVVVFSILAAIALAIALMAPLHTLLLFDLLLSMLPGEWEIKGVRVDATDVVFGVLLLGAALRARRVTGSHRLRIPYLWIWLLLGTLITISYLRAPISQEYLTGPLQIAYQVYRYCWKGLLFYPLCILLMHPPDRLRRLILVVVVVGVLFSIQAIPGGYAGQRGGPILFSNALSLGLHVPLFAVLALLISAKSRNVKVMMIVSLLLVLRAITFSGSRGGFVADLVGIGVLIGLFATVSTTRSRLARLGAAAAVVAAIVLAMKPDVFERPTVRRVLTLSSGEVSTLEWRREERWPHFWAIAVAHPWLGVGTEVDPTLGFPANTPHNGYLSLAVSHGFPALGIVLLFFWLGLRNSILLFRKANDPSYRVFGAVSAASLMAILVHNIVENAFGVPFTAKLFWALTGLAAVGAHHYLAGQDSAGEEGEESRKRSLMRQSPGF